MEGLYGPLLNINLLLKRIVHKDVFGQAATDFLQTGKCRNIAVKSDVSAREYIPSSYLFRNYENMPDIEKEAIKNCRGEIIDIGAGTGCHALELQNRGFKVVAVENSPLLCNAMRKQGIKNVIEQDLWDLTNIKADTILLMMNNLGIAGTLDNLPAFLMHLAEMLRPEGQILATSSDIAYLFDQGFIHTEKYYGELTYTLKYKNCKSDPFPWLFIDTDRLESLMQHIGMQLEILYREDDTHNYLARIVRKL